MPWDARAPLYEVNGSTTGITRFLYDGNDLVSEYNASNTLNYDDRYNPKMISTENLPEGQISLSYT
jgi:hypothetical protein